MVDLSKQRGAEWVEIPGCEGYDPEQGKLTLRGVNKIPEAVFDFAQDYSVKILDASNNPDFSQLPDNFAALPELERAFFSNCSFEEVPTQLRECERLKMLAFKSNGLKEFGEDSLPHSMEWLILTDNEIVELPKSIGDLASLRKVAFAGNPLEGLPGSMQNCRDIELLRVSACNLQTPAPEWVFHLPKLAWYSDGGNFSSSAYPEALSVGVTEINWGDIQFNDVIGESPSSLVSSARVKGFDGEAAVKVFKGGLASDGYAEDDYACSVLAGAHPNLREIWGKGAGHPDGQGFIVMARMPEGFKDLGKPPSLKSVTRDTFEEEMVFEPWFVQSVLKDVANAMLHLHEKGIAHGDLYAHNIQVNSEGRALVGDFGAATYYESGTSKGVLRQRMDVLAFGYLMEDLLQRMSCSEDMFDLGSLKDRCTQEVPLRRPDFREVVKALG